MKRTLSLLLAALMLLSLMPFAVFADSDPVEIPVISVENAYAKPGSTVQVLISVENNPGIVAASLSLSFDPALSLIAAENGDAFSALSMTAPSQLNRGEAITSSCNFNWFASDIAADQIRDGIILRLTFEVSEEAQINHACLVNVSATSGNVIDKNAQVINVITVGGEVAVIDYTPGDVDDNGSINMLDVVLLSRYIVDGCTYDPSGYAVQLVESAANVNDDSGINMLDVVLISRFIVDGCQYDPAGYAVKLIPVSQKCNHTLEAVAAKAATCTEDGNNAYWHCTTCGKYFSDSNATQMITLEDIVIHATGHTFVNEVCVVCGTVEVVPGTVYTIQYNVGMINSNDPSEIAKVVNDTYTVGKAKTLPKLKMDTYTFVGWTDQNGNFYTNNILPPDMTGDLILTDHWVSQRNQAKAKAKLDDPLVVEDTDNQMIYFGYEIGTIENVPLYTTQDLLCVNGIISVKEKVTNHSISREEMNSIGSTVSKETTDSTQVTLSEELTAITEVSNETLHSTGYDKDQAEIIARSQTNTQSYSSSSGGSSESYTYNDSTHRNSENMSYVVNENYDTGASFELQTGMKNTTEVSAGVGLPIDIIKLDLGVKNTTELSLNTDTKTYMDYSVGSTTSWDGHTYDESHQASSTTNTKNWNTSSAKSSALTASQTSSISEAFHEMIADTYRYGETYSKTSGNSELRGVTDKTGQTAETASAVTVTIQNIESETTSFTSTGNTFGSYRLAMMGTMHVFAIVGYDIAKSEYFVYTLSVMGDGSCNDGWHEEIDYSYDRSFNDHENSVIPFEIPMYVEDYVNTRIVKTDGLEYTFNNAKHTATVDAYSGVDRVVYVPSFMVDEEGTAYRVTGISSNAFRGNAELEAVSLGRYVDTIPDAAFKDCTGLEYVICPAVTSIGANAFEGCVSLNEFELSPQITYLGENAFKNAPAVKATVGFGTDPGDLATLNEEEKASVEITLANVTTVAEAVAASGAKSITLDLSRTYFDPKMDLNVCTCDSFVLNGGGKVFTKLTINSYANTTKLNNIVLKDSAFSPVQLHSPNVTLYRFDIENCVSNALVLDCENTTLILSGTNSIETEKTMSILCRDITVYYTNSGRLNVNHDILCYGTFSDPYSRTSISDGSIVYITESEEYEIYKKGLYTIIFDVNDGNALAEGESEKTVYFGSPYGELPTPTRDYYTFAGWFTEAEGGVEVTSETIYDTAEDLTVYAHWIVNKYHINWTDGSGYSAEVERVGSQYAGASLGVISSGAEIYYGDELLVTYTADLGYSINENGMESITVTRDITDTEIFANASVNSYTYNIIYRSSNGTNLGSFSATYNFGTTNTITAPAKSGYNTPASQTVVWDSVEEKTIEFIYTPKSVSSASANGSIYDGLSYSITVNTRNRTASSIEVQVSLTATLAASQYNPYSQQYDFSVQGRSGSAQLCGYNSDWRSYTTYNRQKTGTSSWVTIPINTTNATSVSLSYYYWEGNSNGTNMKSYDGPDKSGSLSVSIPAY